MRLGIVTAWRIFFPRRRVHGCKRLTCFCVGWSEATRSISGCEDRAAGKLIIPSTHSDSRRTMPAADPLCESGVEDGGRHYGVVAEAGSADPVKYDFSLLPPRHGQSGRLKREQGDSLCP